MSHEDSHSVKVTIPLLGLDVPYEHWRTSIEGVLMTKGLHKYIKQPLAADATDAEKDKRTQAFGFILCYLSPGEKQPISAILKADTQDAYALWADIKQRHEKVEMSRVWGYWRRLNAPPTVSLADHKAIDRWFTDTVAAYDAYKASGRLIDEYTACMIMLDNLPEMWDNMRRSITQVTGNVNNMMTFATLRGCMESELIARRPVNDTATDSHALLTRQAATGRPQQSDRHGGQRQSKRPRLHYQRTPGATCSTCKKPNHTAQQCGKTVDEMDEKADGSSHLTTSHSTDARLFEDGYDSDAAYMTTDCSPGSGSGPVSADRDDSSVLATTRDSDYEAPATHWLIDCGASHHYCNDRSLLSRVRYCHSGVKLGNGHRLSVTAEGELTIVLPPHGRKLTITARCVPELRRNLLSAGALGRQGIHVLCAGARAHIYHAQSHAEIGQARRIDEGSEYNLYRIDPTHDTSPLHTALLTCQSNSDTEHDTVSLWHRRLGHSNVRRVRQVFSTGMTADGQALQNRIRPDTPHLQPDRHCDTCAVCKHHAAQRPHSVPAETRASKRPLETVHIDLRGPHSPGIKHELYQLLIVDEHTRYAVGYTLTNKDESLACFEQFATAAHNYHKESGHTIKFIRSDNGGEFIGNEWTPLLTRLGIQRQRTSPHTPYQNGIVERLNRTIGESTRTMLHAAGLPERFWPLACQAAVYINNRLPSKATNNTTPHQLWCGKPPHIGHIRTFGCLAYALVHNPTKLADRAARCTFVGYPTDASRTYLLWDNHQHKLLRSGHVHFVESINGWNYNPKLTVAAGEATAAAGEAAAGEAQIKRPRVEDAAPVPHLPAVPDADHNQPEADIEPIELADDDGNIDQPQSPPAQLNRAQLKVMRQLRDNLVPAAHDRAPAVAVTDAMLQSGRRQLRGGPSQQHFYGSVHITQQPPQMVDDDSLTYSQVTSSPDRDKWLSAIRNELNSLMKARTWRYVQMPSAANLVGCKWIFKIKRDKDGDITKFKARLVARGFTQVYGVDYAETYAPVARYASIRLIIALAAHYNWELHQISTMTTLMDVKTAYLNGELDVPIYMQAPDGLELIDQTCPPHHVCLLIKSLYGLKQSGRRWHSNINHSLITHGFTPLHADRCVYVRRKGDCIDIIALYVDDLLIASSRTSELLAIKRRLTQQYEMEDMGEATFILGIDIRRDRANRTISIGQSAYINTLLARHGMADCNPSTTPMEAGIVHELVAAADGYEASTVLTRNYQSIIGGLMFAAICTRPDIAFAVSRLSRYCSNPTDLHLNAAKRILRYLKGTATHCITYTGSTERHPQLVGYCDADWAQDKDCKRKSTSGYVFVLCGGAISWQSKKQSTIALSSTEAELMAITSSTKELLWFRHHLRGLGLSHTQPTTLLVDSQCALDIANNSKISDRSKHIEVQHFFIRDHIEAKTVQVQHTSSATQAADTLTKPLLRVAFKRCADMLGLSQRQDKVKAQRVH